MGTAFRNYLQDIYSFWWVSYGLQFSGGPPGGKGWMAKRGWTFSEYSQNLGYVQGDTNKKYKHVISNNKMCEIKRIVLVVDSWAGNEGTIWTMQYFAKLYTMFFFALGRVFPTHSRNVFFSWPGIPFWFRWKLPWTNQRKSAFCSNFKECLSWKLWW